MKKTLISIVTVVWNDANGLKRTIQSLLNQTYKNYELIIIDGNSSDGTIDIIKQYEDQISYWVSEQDGGIYDAMNKGIRASNGDWINFMNAGDTFYSDNILSRIDFHKYSNTTLLYGNQMKGNVQNIPFDTKILEIGGTFACHQAMFFNANILGDDLIYSLAYPIYADYELVTKIYLKYPNTFIYININVTDFEGGGISSKITTQKRIDRYKIVFKYYGIKGVIGALFHNIHRRIN